MTNIPTEKKSLEKVGFAMLASFAIAPFIHALLHCIFSGLIGGHGDAYHVMFAGLMVTGAVGLVRLFLSHQSALVRLSIIGVMGIILGLVFGAGLPSQLTLALTFCSLGLILHTFSAWLVAQLPDSFDGLIKKYKIRTVLFLLMASLSIYQVTKLSVFMNDWQYVEASGMPGEHFFVHHSCLTAYVHGTKLIKEENINIYDTIHYPYLSAKEYPPFCIDAYMYPPQFILLPTVLFSMTDSFATQRVIWFGFYGLLVYLAFWLIAKWTSEKDETHSLLLVFLPFTVFPVFLTMQIGNFQHIVMAIAMLGMLAFEQKRPALGGALLAFAIASKVSPALLVVILLVQRRWRDIVWTAGFGLFFTGLAVIFWGISPLIDFLTYQLPLLNSGRAMPWIDQDWLQALINTGPFSIPFKLGFMGIELENPWGVGKMLNTTYTLLILIVIVFFARKEKNNRQKACFWLAVLTLSGLQSPFAPTYVLITLFWGLSLVGAEINSTKKLVLFILVWIYLAVPFGLLLADLISIAAVMVMGLIQMLLIFIAIGYLMAYRPKSIDAEIIR